MSFERAVRTAIVTTTIRVPALLDDYCRNARRYGHESVELIVAGDKKSPPETGPFCRQLQDEHGYPAVYLDVERQEAMLERFPELAAHLPYHSLSRRNVAVLAAYECGADAVITIDDDNLVTDEDFVGGHGIVGTRVSRAAVTSPTGWYNVCRLLVEAQDLPFYHRGFPMGERWHDGAGGETGTVGPAHVAVNAGLWLGDPDIDALARMDLPIRSTGVTAQGREGVVLAPGTWCPFNSQNTALAREAVPAYFLSPHAGRYDDVWASYVVRAISDHLGHAVAYGSPLVQQVRNAHDLWHDLELERAGMRMTDRLTAILRRLAFSERSYGGCFREAVRQLDDLAARGGAPFTPEEWDILRRVVDGMQAWVKTFERLAQPATHPAAV